MGRSSGSRKRLLQAVLGCLAAAALPSIAVVLGGSPHGTAGTVIASAFLLPLGCLRALAGSTVLERLPALELATVSGVQPC